MIDNSIDLEDFKEKLNHYLNNKDVKSIIIVDDIDDKLTREFEETIRFADFIKHNTVLMEICAFKDDSEYIFGLNVYKNINMSLQPQIESILKNINNTISAGINKSINENKNTIRNEFKLQNKYFSINDNIKDEEFENRCIKLSHMTGEELIKLINKEIYRLNPKSINDLFNKKETNNKMPSRTSFYQIFAEEKIQEFRDLINFINNNDSDAKKEFIIDKLRKFYHKYHHVPTTKECTEIIGIHHNTVRYYFGKYSDAIEAAGLKKRNFSSPSKEEILEEIKKLSKVVEKNTVAEYKNHDGRYHWYLKYFGTFPKALEVAGVIKK